MPNGIWMEDSLIYFRHLKVSLVKAYQISCLFIFTSISQLTRLKGFVVEMYGMKTIELTLNAHLFQSSEIKEKVGLYTSNTLKVTVSKSCTIVTLEQESEKSFIIAQNW